MALLFVAIAIDERNKARIQRKVLRDTINPFDVGENR